MVFGVPLHDLEQRIAKVWAIQRFEQNRMIRVGLPCYTKYVFFLTRSYRYPSLCRMQQELDVLNIHHLLTALAVEGYLIAGNRHARQLASRR